MAVVRVGDRPISFDRGPSHLVKILLLIMIMIMILMIMIMIMIMIMMRMMVLMMMTIMMIMMRMMRMMIRYQLCGHYSDDNDVLMSIIMIESAHLLDSPHLVVRQHLNPRTKTEHTLETKKLTKLNEKIKEAKEQQSPHHCEGCINTSLIEMMVAGSKMKKENKRL